MKTLQRLVLAVAITALVSTSAMAATVSFDFRSGNVQSGWTQVDNAGNGSNGTVSISTATVGVSLDSRDRGGGNGGGAESQMWRDFLFANGSNALGEGLDLTITGLVPHTTYPVRLWSFDDSSNGGRAATWNGTLSSFPNSPDPATLADYVAKFKLTSDNTGAALVEGRVAANNGEPHHVFINGLEIGDPLAPPPPTRAGVYQGVVLDDNPVGYWRLGEAVGSTAVDISGNTRDLTYNNTPLLEQTGAVVGDADTAVKIAPGSPTPTISRSNTGDFGFASGQSFSAEYWVKALPGNSTVNDAGLLVKGYDSSQVRPWYLSRYKATGQVDWFLRNTGGTNKVVTSAAAVNDGQWHHIVGVYDNLAAETRLYVDGVFQGAASGVPVDAYGANSRPFTIANHLNRNVDASFDEVAMYDSALSTLQVQEHYSAGIAAPLVNVDFGRDPSSGGGPGGTMPGFNPLEAAEGGGNRPATGSFGFIGGSETVDVKISGYTHFRDYAAVTGRFAGQSPLLSDMVLRNADGTMKLTLDNLTPGTYEITTFHHSTQFGGGTFDIRLYDAAAPGQIVANSVPVTDGANPSIISTQTFQFTAGGSSVMIDFLGGTSGDHSSLNGFELQFVAPGPEITKAEVLKIDFNDRGATGPGNTQDGFDEFVLAGSSGGTQSYGAIDVTLSHPTGGVLDDRRRGQPTNGGDFTQQELLRDLIFARGTTAANGLDVLIEGLEPDAQYEVTVWSYDDGSTSNARLSDWFANGTLMMDDYIFDGDADPTSDLDYQFSFLANADTAGDLLVGGRAAGGDDPNVFISALALSKVSEVVPEPSTFALAALGLLGLGLIARRRKSA